MFVVVLLVPPDVLTPKENSKRENQMVFSGHYRVKLQDLGFADGVTLVSHKHNQMQY